MKVITIVGARPQFIKAGPVSTALRESGCQEILVHTGQHYDRGMSQIFFEELGIPEPDVNLGVGSGSHGVQTGKMLTGIEEIVSRERPDCVVVYGDTNSTLAGALAAVKLQIPVVHVEAGLRSFNRDMPEEHNRVLTDHCSQLLFCPTQTAVENLRREGIIDGVHLVGDTMYDAVLKYADIANQSSTVLKDLGVDSKNYLLATVHRAYNTDNPENLLKLLRAFMDLDETVIFPTHPRTRKNIAALNGTFASDSANSKLRIIDPVGYLDMLLLERHARMILTDSGGMQKEAYFFGVPCVTLRPETEWKETVDAGWNVIVGTDKAQIERAVSKRAWPRGTTPQLFGDGHAAKRIVEVLSAAFGRSCK